MPSGSRFRYQPRQSIVCNCWARSQSILAVPHVDGHHVATGCTSRIQVFDMRWARARMRAASSIPSWRALQRLPKARERVVRRRWVRRSRRTQPISTCGGRFAASSISTLSVPLGLDRGRLADQPRRRGIAVCFLRCEADRPGGSVRQIWSTNAFGEYGSARRSQSCAQLRPTVVETVVGRATGYRRTGLTSSSLRREPLMLAIRPVDDFPRPGELARVIMAAPPRR